MENNNILNIYQLRQLDCSEDEKCQHLKDMYGKCIERNRANIFNISQILKEAKCILSKERFWDFCNSPKINLKQTQANKLIAIANLKVHKIYIGTKITDTNIGIERLYLISKFDNKDIQIELIKLLVKNNYSVKEFRYIINKILNEQFCINDAIQALSEHKANASKKTKKIPYAQLLEKYEQAIKEIAILKERWKSND